MDTKDHRLLQNSITKITIALFFAGMTLIFIAGTSNAENSKPIELPDEFTAVLSGFLGKETAPVIGSDGKWHVVYELWLTNGKQMPANIEKIEVLNYDDQSQIIQTLDDEILNEATFELSARPKGNAMLEPNESMLVYLELEFDSPEQVPDRIVHRLIGTGATNPGSRAPDEINYLVSPWDISEKTLPVIGPPLQGEGWVAINGCCLDKGAHRGAIQTVNGTLFNSQRYAIDWMKLGENGAFVDGDPDDVNSWHDYDQPVLAVADGTVVEALDGLDDQVPGSLPDPLSITLETVDGNHVILDLGNGVYAFYAHLKKNSVAVKKGDEVSLGQEIGRLGNSGNTSAPHLHLHLMTRPSAIASDGIPYVFNEFTLQGQIGREDWDTASSINGAWAIQTDETGNMVDMLPMGLSIVSWPSGN